MRPPEDHRRARRAYLAQCWAMVGAWVLLPLGIICPFVIPANASMWLMAAVLIASIACFVIHVKACRFLDSFWFGWRSQGIRREQQNNGSAS